MMPKRAVLPTIHKVVTPQNVRTFRTRVYQHYWREKRDFPWRRTRDPYRILVSEMMLQQTQAKRVVPKYRAFLRRFPSVRALARAPKRDVLAAWQGLGYNRRALLLHRAAQAIVQKHGGRVPKKKAELQTLPGIGPYTAAAVLVFAYNEPAVCIETNIRTVYLHHFFAGRPRVSDRDIEPLLLATLDESQPCKWYQALMDYGAHLKQTVGNASRGSAHYTKQSAFEGSPRQLRGAIVRLLLSSPALSPERISKQTKRSRTEVETELSRLAQEGMVVRRRKSFALA